MPADMEDKDMMTVTTPTTPKLLPLASSWMTGAARVGPYLVVRMEPEPRRGRRAVRCPACGRGVTCAANGRMRTHRAPGDSPRPNCRASGRRPENALLHPGSLAGANPAARLYAYDAPRWALGVLRGWSAQGASVGRLWRTLALVAFARVEVEVAEVDLVPALTASLEAA